MATAHSNVVRASVTVPLLDASSLPSFDDWALLETLHVDGDSDEGIDLDRLGQFRLNASVDE